MGTVPKKTVKQAMLERRTGDLISVTEAANLSGLSTSYIRRLVSTGQIEGVKVGRSWLTTEEAIRAFLEQERRPGPKPRQKK